MMNQICSLSKRKSYSSKLLINFLRIFEIYNDQNDNV